jgi:signal transduction histidine kinase
MNWRRRKRQVLLFLGVILVPAVVLVGLALRVYRQEAELAVNRIAELRRASLDQLRRELAARLETIKLQEINRIIRDPLPAASERHSDPSVVFVTGLIHDQLVLPWTHVDSNSSKVSQAVYALLHEGESLEFARKDFRAAATLYGQAVSSARTLADECESRLSLARVTDARAAFSAMLSRCGAAEDEFAIPYRLYAATRLIEIDPASGDARDFVQIEAQSTAWRSPAQLYMLQRALERISDGQVVAARERLSRRISETEQVEGLAKDFSKIAARMEPQQTVWIPFGEQPWLVTVTPSAPTLPPLVLVVSAPAISPPEVRLVTTQAVQMELIGESFPGLRVDWAQDRMEGTGRRIPASLYIAGIAMIIGLTLLAGYLLLRDVDRDMRTAEMRSHFVAGVSHELKTPLTVIRMYAEMLVRGQTGDSQTTAEYQQTILHESDRLTQLVDNVLDFSRIEQDNRIYFMRPTLLPDVVRSAARAVQYTLAQQGFELNVSIDETLPVLAVDASALEQAIVNLLTNAMKYSGKSRRIELLLKRDVREAAIEVKDWGLGIPSEDQSRIFEKFYRVRSTETEAITGTGLGLTLVAHIVRAHGGSIAVNSEPGRGSTFAIRLPYQASGATA